MTKKIALALMVLSIALMGFQIGATAKNGTNEYFYFLPIAMALLIGGLILWMREVRKNKS